MPHHMWIWWICFHLFLVLMLAIDLGVFHRKSHEVKVRESLIWTGVWIALALLFNLGIYLFFGDTEEIRKNLAMEFLAGYLIEKSLSVDNLFVFALLFSYFHVPVRYQHKVLFWGIIGALVMRAIFIFAGVALVNQFHWTLYIFGLLLIVSGVKMALEKDKEIHPERNPILRLVRRWLPVSSDYVEDKFFVRVAGKFFVTPLFVVLILVEVTDLIFAVDSIPAILGVTRNQFIVYTSNAMAILGLRSLYFALASIMKMFHHLHYGLSAILIFVGAKMLLEGFYKLPTMISLCVIAVILTASVFSSIISNRRNAGKAPALDLHHDPDPATVEVPPPVV